MILRVLCSLHGGDVDPSDVFERPVVMWGLRAALSGLKGSCEVGRQTFLVVVGENVAPVSHTQKIAVGV